VSNAVGTYGLAALLDPRFGAVRDEVSAKTGKKPAAWIRLRGTQ